MTILDKAAPAPLAQQRISERSHWSWPKRLGIGLLILAPLCYVAFRQVQAASDGPLNDIIPGGRLTSGEWVTAVGTGPVVDAGTILELQLEDPARSRYVGAFVHDGALYIPCDLGFIWGRFEGTQRHLMHLVYRFKNWHYAAERNGNVVLRVDGKRYPMRAIRVTDPALQATLRTRLEAMARDWVAPAELGPAPRSGPRDIWFFRLDSRLPPAA